MLLIYKINDSTICIHFRENSSYVYVTLFYHRTLEKTVPCIDLSPDEYFCCSPKVQTLQHPEQRHIFRPK